MSYNFPTLQTYNQAVQAYVDGTPQEVSGSVKEWIDHTLNQIPRDARILEIGSGFGRDAQYMVNAGYQVERSDAAQGFVDLLRAKGHRDTKLFNVLTDPYDGSYDLVFANAVFLHFTRQELPEVLHKTYSALNQNGILSFSVKLGDDEEWTNEKVDAPRYFCYWQKEELERLVKEAGFEMVSGNSDGKFIQIIAKRIGLD